MKPSQTALLGLTLLLAPLTHAGESTTPDWRQTASSDEKVKNLTKVMPGASTLMLQMGERYRNMYWAGKLGKWEFAEYQVEEIEEIVKTLIITRPGRAETAQDFLDTGLHSFATAFKKRDWLTFKTAFEQMHVQCITCHARNAHAFITLPKIPAMGNSLVLEVTP